MHVELGCFGLFVSDGERSSSVVAHYVEIGRYYCFTMWGLSSCQDGREVVRIRLCATLHIQQRKPYVDQVYAVLLFRYRPFSAPLRESS